MDPIKNDAVFAARGFDFQVASETFCIRRLDKYDLGIWLEVMHLARNENPRNGALQIAFNAAAIAHHCAFRRYRYAGGVRVYNRARVNEIYRRPGGVYHGRDFVAPHGHGGDYEHANAAASPRRPSVARPSLTYDKSARKYTARAKRPFRNTVARTLWLEKRVI